MIYKLWVFIDHQCDEMWISPKHDPDKKYVSELDEETYTYELMTKTAVKKLINSDKYEIHCN
jgi:hypothetical protein